MNYNEFLSYKDDLLKKDGLIDLSENNIYKKFNFDLLKDFKINGHINGNIHRCHLVEDWLNLFDICIDIKKDIGVSHGVRNSLEILSEEFKTKKWLVPKDVYPYYQNLLNDKKIKYEEYKTLKNEELFDDLNNADILLLTYPLKPLGRELTDKELGKIRSWVDADKKRRLIIDAVYLDFLDNNVKNKILNLYFKDNVYVLFSLSKIFVAPNVFGLTMIPKQDNYIREIFKNFNYDKTKLKIAFAALNNKNNEKIRLFLRENYENNYLKVKNLLKEYNIHIKNFNNGYLYWIENDYKELLDNKILLMPASIFNGEKGSVISFL